MAMCLFASIIPVPCLAPWQGQASVKERVHQKACHLENDPDNLNRTDFVLNHYKITFTTYIQYIAIYMKVFLKDTGYFTVWYIFADLWYTDSSMSALHVGIATPTLTIRWCPEEQRSRSAGSERQSGKGCAKPCAPGPNQPASCSLFLSSEITFQQELDVVFSYMMK